MTRAQLVKAALKAHKKEQTNNANSDGNLSTPQSSKGGKAVKETSQGNPLKTVPNVGLPNPKKPNNTQPSSTDQNPNKPRPLFDPNLVKYRKGKAGKSPVDPPKAAGAVFWPKAKTR